MLRRWFVAGLTGAVLSAVAGVPAWADTPALTGSVVDMTGAPVAACLTLVDAGGAEIAGPCTGADGTYTVPSSIQGEFRVRAHADGYVDLWGNEQLSLDSAQLIEVFPSSHTVLNFTMFHAAATVTGRITRASGEPVNGVDVVAVPPGGVFFYNGYSALTDADGRYRLVVPPGQYQIGYSEWPFGTMWAPGKEQQSDAQVYPLGEGATASIDGAFLPLGTLELVIRDSVSGALVQRGCASIYEGWDEVCTTNGVIRITDVPPGDWSAVLRPDGTHWPTTAQGSARRGQTTVVNVPVQRAAAVVTATQDARTHRPVAGVCVRAVDAAAGIPYGGDAYCSDADGRLVVGPLDPATVDLFAFTSDGSYGAQWVSSFGGTGDRRRARHVSVSTAAPVILPPIQLDRAGTIAGVVQDKAAGTPIGRVCVYPYAFDPINGGGSDPGSPNCTDATGHYQITGLGPYAWPVEFVATDTHAWQWSGGATNRYDATPVTVRTGQTATANANLVPGARVSGVVADTAGTPMPGLVIVRNAKTGDVVGTTRAQPNLQYPYQVDNLAAQNVKIEYYVNGTHCYYDRKTTQATATVVTVTGDRTVNLTGCG